MEVDLFLKLKASQPLHMHNFHLRIELRIDILEILLKSNNFLIEIPLLILELINFASDLSLNLLTFLLNSFPHFSILLLLKLFHFLLPYLILCV